IKRGSKNGRQVTYKPLNRQLGSCPSILYRFQGPNVRIRDIAKEKGLKINEYGVFRVGDDLKVAGKSEEEVYEAIGCSAPLPKSGKTGEKLSWL
ncbi:MAG: hypothetical protein Q9N34_00545, partial [Aquificota bacterium]|nr:hypothetical protein [Aquificota bacterium]